MRATTAGGQPMLEGVDSGPGIPEAERERVFDRFFRGEAGLSDKDGPGSGLGLAIVQAIAQRHDAQVRIDAESADGRSRVRVPFVTRPSHNPQGACSD